MKGILVMALLVGLDTLLPNASLVIFSVSPMRARCLVS
jgi:hypothetical protein